MFSPNWCYLNMIICSESNCKINLFTIGCKICIGELLHVRKCFMLESVLLYTTLDLDKSLVFFHDFAFSFLMSFCFEINASFLFSSVFFHFSHWNYPHSKINLLTLVIFKAVCCWRFHIFWWDLFTSLSGGYLIWYGLLSFDSVKDLINASRFCF